MRVSAIIRIVIWSFVALLLTAVLCLGIFADFFSFIPEIISEAIDSEFSYGLGYTYSDSNLYIPTDGTAEVSGVDEIDLNWVAGSVTIKTYEGDNVIFSESSSSAISEANRMRYYVNNGKLTIQYRESISYSFGSRSIVKNLEMLVPERLLRSFRVDAVSAKISLLGITADSINIESVSGLISIDNSSAGRITIEQVSGSVTASGITADYISVSSTSGNTDVSGVIGEIRHEGVSGSIAYTSYVCPGKVYVTTVSSGITLTIPENEGFTAKYDMVSGRFSNDFPSVTEKSISVYGNGGAQFDFESLSGGIRICKLG